MDQMTPDPLTTNRAYRRPITVTVDVELLEAIERKRGWRVRSPHVEQVPEAAMLQEHPHRPTGRPRRTPSAATRAWRVVLAAQGLT